ncbi:MAG: DUF4880 domain-containing protein [Pseudomonadota bacterium]
MARKPTTSTTNRQAAADQASEWFARLGSPHATAEERRAAERWAAQSSENGEAWTMVQDLWRGLGAAPDHPSVDDLRAEALAAAEARRRSSRAG